MFPSGCQLQRSGFQKGDMPALSSGLSQGIGILALTAQSPSSNLLPGVAHGPEIIPFEPDLGNSSVGTGTTLIDSLEPFPAGNGFSFFRATSNRGDLKMTAFADKAAQNLSELRKQKPLVHNITNFVVMNVTANALLSMGASPVMAHAPNEVEEMVSFAGSLVLNIGTLTDAWVSAMETAAKKAARNDTPIILDPVGSGATSLRTASAKRLIQTGGLSVIRGNASEVLSLRDNNSRTKGVDSIHAVDEAADTAKILAAELQTTLAITGPVDLVTDGESVLRITNGDPLMAYVTGTGCMATATIGAFLAVDQNPVTATATALAFFGLAGEIAARKAQAPGSFMVALLDALYTLTPKDLADGCRIE